MTNLLFEFLIHGRHDGCAVLLVGLHLLIELFLGHLAKVVVLLRSFLLHLLLVFTLLRQVLQNLCFMVLTTDGTCLFHHKYKNNKN